MLERFKSLFGPMKPLPPPEVIRRFHTGDATISRDGIAVDNDGWLVDSVEGRTVQLFEVPDPGAERCLLIYRATMKSEGLSGRAYLEMWCRLPGRGEFFSRGVRQPLKGTTGWVCYEIPFYLKKGQRPDLIKLNLVVDGRGRLWMREVELLKLPLGSR